MSLSATLFGSQNTAKPTPCPAPETPWKTNIWVVDDESDICSIYEELLRMTGYVPHIFMQREEVLAAARETDWPPALLITDLLGHRLDTGFFMHQLRRQQPAIRILMATGCPASCLSHLEAKPDGFLQKPFEIPALLHEIDRLIGGNAGA